MFETPNRFDPDVEFDDDNLSLGRTLQCPKCGSNHLHQCGVDVFIRESEGCSNGTHVSAKYRDNACVVDADDIDAAGTPSKRRDGIVIQFRCELCNGDEDSSPIYELVIKQREGNEIMQWREHTE